MLILPMQKKKPSYKELERRVGKLEETVMSYQKNFVSIVRNLGEKKREDIALKRANERFHAIMNSMDAIVYVADMETHELLFTNRLFDALFGENRIGEKCYSVLQGKSDKCDFCTNHFLFDKDGNPGQCYVWEFQNLVTRRWYQCHDQAILWSSGKIVRLEIANDITERKEFELRLKEREEKLRELNSTKDKFFSIIAHDLKNPFSVLQSGAELLSIYLEKNNLARAKAKSLSIYEAAKQVHSLLENLLEWARSQTNSIQFEPVNFNLKNFVAECVADVENLAKNKTITIFSEIPDGLKLVADKKLLSVIFRNLLTNAIKFTYSEGHIFIKCNAGEESCMISIQDTGIGIAREHQEKLFRIDAHYTRPGTAGETGTSLGLILCKEFIEKHGGKIWVESEVNTGSEFKFTIPHPYKSMDIPANTNGTALRQTTINFPG